MKRKANKGIGLLLLLALLGGCKEERPKGVLEPTAMKELLYDFHLTQVLVNDLPSSERYKKELYFNYLFKKHHTTQAQMDSSLVWYARYPKELSVMYEGLSTRLEAEVAYLDEKMSVIDQRAPKEVVGDSAELWYERNLYLFTGSPLSNRLLFSVPVDSNFKRGDRLEWSAEGAFFPADADTVPSKAVFSLILVYDNDSVLAIDSVITTSGHYLLALQDTASHALKEVSGSVYYKDPAPSGWLALFNLSLKRYHSPEFLRAPLEFWSADSVRRDSVLRLLLRKQYPAVTTDSLALDSLLRDSLLCDSLLRNFLLTDTVAAKPASVPVEKKVRENQKPRKAKALVLEQKS